MGLGTDIIMGLMVAVLVSVLITEVYATTITNATTASTPTITEEEEEEEMPTTLDAYFVKNKIAQGSRLAPLDGMILAGIIEYPPEEDVTLITLWEWESGRPLLTTTSGANSTDFRSATGDIDVAQ